MRRRLTQGMLGIVTALVVTTMSTAAALADPRDFMLMNNDPEEVIDQIYVSPSNQTSWGDDVLGQDVLEPGQMVNIHFQRFTEGDCLYDIRVVGQDGSDATMDRVNLCEITTVTFGG